MKANKWAWQLSLRLVVHILISFLLTLPTMYAAASIIERISKDFPEFRQFLIRMYFFLGGERNSLSVIGFVLFIVYMVLLNYRRFRYFGELKESVRRIADGQMDEKLPVRQGNELGQLAEDVNRLVRRLEASLDDERKAEQTKNELITSVSHDLRTPLTSILGYLGLVNQDRYRDEVELRHYTQIAYDKSKRLEVLIHDLFEYTRTRYDSVPLRCMTLNLPELVGELLQQYRLQLEEGGMEGVFLSAEPTILIQGDPNKLVRVFENLLINAMTYGKEGKRIDVAVRREQREAIVEVANYGEPIPSVDLPHIFDRFYRVDKARSEHTGGSGLGLAIAKGIVERHGGTIKAESGYERTVFEVRLPASILRES